MRWGFQWGKVAGGGLLLVGGGAIFALGLMGGYIIIWAGIAAVVGLFTMLTGLIGEEGTW